MAYQWLHSLEKTPRMWKLGVNVECSFTQPARVEVEQSRISHGKKDVDRQATRFCARRRQHIAQRICEGFLLALASVEAGKNEQLTHI